MISKKLVELCDRLTTAGVPTVFDPIKLHPPGAWLAARRIIGQTLSGEWLFEYDLYLVVPECDIPVALTKLEQLLEKALPVIEGDIRDSDLGTTVTLPYGGACPAFRFTISPPSY